MYIETRRLKRIAKIGKVGKVSKVLERKRVKGRGY